MNPTDVMVTNQWLLNFLKMFPLKESILSWFSVWKAVIVTWLLRSLMQCVCIRHCPAWTEKTTKRTITQINIQIIKELLFVYLDIYEFIRFWIEMSRSILGPAQTHLFIRQTFIKSPIWNQHNSSQLLFFWKTQSCALRTKWLRAHSVS